MIFRKSRKLLVQDYAEGDGDDGEEEEEEEDAEEEEEEEEDSGEDSDEEVQEKESSETAQASHPCIIGVSRKVHYRINVVDLININYQLFNIYIINFVQHRICAKSGVQKT